MMYHSMKHAAVSTLLTALACTLSGCSSSSSVDRNVGGRGAAAPVAGRLDSRHRT